MIMTIFLTFIPNLSSYSNCQALIHSFVEKLGQDVRHSLAFGSFELQFQLAATHRLSLALRGSFYACLHCRPCPRVIHTRLVYFGNVERRKIDVGMKTSRLCEITN